MTDPGLMKAICDDPDDDAPRLVYADWLDDHDQPARAEFIRLQCRLAQMDEDEEGLTGVRFLGENNSRAD